MQNINKIIFALLTTVLIVVLLIGWYQNKGLIEKKEQELKQPYQTVRIGDEDDYYELRIPREFLPTKYTDGRSVSFDDILYPEMRRWNGERRENIDNSKVEFWITYHTGESSRLNSQDFRLQNSKALITPINPTDEPSKKLIKKYPSINVYADKKTKEVSDYVFTDKNGFIVIGSDSYGDTYRIHVSYNGKFDITVQLPGVYFYEMPDVTNSVIDLVSTFNPTHYKNHNSQYDAATDQEVELLKSKEKIQEKTPNKTSSNKITASTPAQNQSPSSVKK